MRPKTLAKNHPAETATPPFMILAAALGYWLNWDATTISYVAILVSFVPAAVTWLVNLIRG